MNNPIRCKMRLKKKKYGEFYISKSLVSQIAKEINFDKWENCYVGLLSNNSFYICPGSTTLLSKQVQHGISFHIPVGLASVGKKSLFSLPIGEYKIKEIFGERIVFEAIYCKI